MRIFYNEELKQINVLDERFYTDDNVNFYPSATTVLGVYPKGKWFEEWLKSVGVNADDIRDRAAETGSVVHEAIDNYLKGKEIKWFSENHNELYTLEQWQMIQKFVEFWTTHKPILISTEVSLISHKMKLGGTIDLVCKIGEDIWMIDHKTSNSIQKTHELQLAAYVQMWNELNPQYKVNRYAVMHLKAATRGVDKRGKNIQGKGWKLHEFSRPQNEAYKLFRYTRAIWDEENPNYKPKNLIYPVSFKREDIVRTA